MASKRRASIRPNPKRQAFYAGIVLVAVLAGYAVWVLWLSPASPRPPEDAVTEEKPHAWYKDQGTPPHMVDAPSAPIFAEPDAQPSVAVQTETIAPLVYEESLPHEVYVAPEASEIVPSAPPPTVESATDSQTASIQAAWLRHAIPVAPTAQPNAPLIAIVIDDMGLDRKRSAKILDLPPPLTVSYLTYAKQLQHQTAVARAAGHELMAHVAMEPSSAAVDPGPLVLLTSHDGPELRRRLERGLDRLPDAIGINNHMGSRFTEDAPGMTLVLDILRQRGLMFLDSRTSAKSVGGKIARSLGVPVVERNVFLDNVNDRAAVLKRLAETERLAKRRGHAIAIGHPRDGTIEALAQWLPTAQKRGFHIVPVSAVLKKVSPL